jgi:uncharacterized protein (TIGR02246 family)
MRWQAVRKAAYTGLRYPPQIIQPGEPVPRTLIPVIPPSSLTRTWTPGGGSKRMKALAAICCAAALACTMAGCHGTNDMATAPPPDTHDADVKAISDTEAQWSQTWQARDLDKIMAAYADDAVLMTPGAPPAQGKDNIRKVGVDMLKDPSLVLSFKPSRVDVSGPLGYTQGAYTMRLTDPKTHKLMEEHGSYVTTWRKQSDGSWKAVADIATPSGPEMPVSPAKKM